jgi:hypothetical protein
MLFFFEIAFFLLAVAAIVVVEVWGPGRALSLWAAITLMSLVAAPIVKGRLSRTAAQDRVDAQWRRTLVDSWRHFNKLLVLGLLPLAIWWWLSGGLGR